MDRRLELHQLLMDVSGLNTVYFQPPPNVKLTYPCIIYQRESIKSHHADNLNYTNKTRYQVTYINRMPDNDIVGKLLTLPNTSYSRFFISDNLNHDVLTIYF